MTTLFCNLFAICKSESSKSRSQVEPSGVFSQAPSKRGSVQPLPHSAPHEDSRARRTPAEMKRWVWWDWNYLEQMFWLRYPSGNQEWRSVPIGKESHFPNRLWMGYVSFLEGRWLKDDNDWNWYNLPYHLVDHQLVKWQLAKCLVFGKSRMLFAGVEDDHRGHDTADTKHLMC